MTDKEFKYKLSKDAHAARALAYWGIACALIPLLGWLFGGISLAKSRSIPSEELSSEAQKFNGITTTMARVVLVASTLVFLIFTVVGVWTYYENQRTAEREKAQAAEEVKRKKHGARDACFQEAAKLRVPVRAQHPGESFVDYMNYSSSTNSAEENARGKCIDTYGL